MEHTEPLFKKYKLLTVSDIFKSRLFIFYHKLINNELPTKLSSIVSFSETIVDNNISLLSTYQPQTRSAESCLRFFLPHTINSCPRIILDALHDKAEKSFSNFIKNHLLSEYSDFACIADNCYSCRLKRNFHSL